MNEPTKDLPAVNAAAPFIGGTFKLTRRAGQSHFNLEIFTASGVDEGVYYPADHVSLFAGSVVELHAFLTKYLDHMP